MLKLGIDPEKLYQTTFTAYVVAIWPLFLFDSFVNYLEHLRKCFGQMAYRPPWQKTSRTPMSIYTTL